MLLLNPAYIASVAGQVLSSSWGDNYSLYFDGTNDYVNVPYDTGANIGSGDFTFSFWVNFSSLASNLSPYLLYMGHATADQNYFLIYYDTSTGGLTVNCREGSAGNATFGTGIIYKDVWYHVVVTRTGTTMEIFLNGNSVNSSTSAEFGTTLGVSGNTLFRLGNTKSGSVYYFNGFMSNVCLWDEVISDDEILQIYNAGKATNLLSDSGSYSSTANVATYYEFENDATDSVSGGSNATLTNGPVYSSEVPNRDYDYSVNFDGTNDYITVPDSNNFSFGDGSSDEAFTLSTWVYLSSTQNARLVSKRSSSTLGREYTLSIQSSKIQFTLFDQSVSWGYIFAETTAVSAGLWYLITAVYSGSGDESGLSIYVNGVDDTNLRSYFGSYTAMENHSSAVYFGSNGYDSTYCLNGKMCNVAIWRKELTSQEITALYNSGQTLDASSDSGNYTSSSNLVGYWRLNEGVGTKTLDSVSTNHGTLTNGPTWSGDVPTIGYEADTYLDFDGTNDYVDLGTSVKDLFSGAVALSISAWVKIDSFPASNGVIFQQESIDAGDNLMFCLRVRSIGEIDFYLRDTSGSYFEARKAVSTGVWYNFIGVFDGSEGSSRIYINGVEGDSNTSIGSTLYTLTEGSEEAAIGSIGIGTNRYFNGTISQVTLWNEALTPAEVLAIYNLGRKNADLSSNSGNYTSSSGLIGYWKLDDAPGTTAVDSSSNSNDGTLINGPTWTTNFDQEVYAPTKSASLDGTGDYLSVNYNMADSIGTGAFTLSMWVKFNDYTNAMTLCYIGKDTANEDYMWLKTSDSLGINVVFRDGASGTASLEQNVGTFCGEWYHIVITRTSTTAELFVNGVSVDSGTNAEFATNFGTVNNTQFILGDFRIGGASGAEHNGNIKDICLWNEVITDNEIAEIYNGGVPFNLLADRGDYASSANVQLYLDLEESA